MSPCRSSQASILQSPSRADSTLKTGCTCPKKETLPSIAVLLSSMLPLAEVDRLAQALRDAEQRAAAAELAVATVQRTHTEAVEQSARLQARCARMLLLLFKLIHAASKPCFSRACHSRHKHEQQKKQSSLYYSDHVTRLSKRCIDVLLLAS